MAELTIVFRLRFAIALTLALGLFLISSAREALGAEYIVQMDSGSLPSDGVKLVERLDGQVTSPMLGVINGFGARLDEGAAARLEASPGVRAVSPNGGVETSSHGEDRDERDGRGRGKRGRDRDDDGRGKRGRDRDRDRDERGERGDRDDDEDTSGGYRCPRTDATTHSAPRVKSAHLRRADFAALLSVPKLRQPLHHSVRVDRAWLRSTGSDVGVAVIDTGIAGDLPDFRDSDDPTSSRVIASAVTNPCASDANDHFGHGTHVAGLIAGNGLHYPDERRGRYMGIAPDANLISVKTSDDDGSTTVLDVIYGIQFAVDHRHELGIRVVNLSLSSTVPESYLTDPLNAAAESAWFSGLVVVAAAGNEGKRPTAVSYAPGNDPYVITAGSLDDRGTWRNSDDVLASWSSRGVTQDGVQKPDVLAPGVGLVAALAPNSDFNDLCRGCVVDGRYFRASGTSMSTAVVSGAAALILEEHPDWSPDQVKGAMKATLENVPGAGAALDVAAALDGSGLANQGLVPNTLVSPETGEIDWTRASFRRASFRDANGSEYHASWSRASFRCDCSMLDLRRVDPNRSSFRSAGFMRTLAFEE